MIEIEDEDEGEGEDEMGERLQLARVFHALHAFACQGQVTMNRREIHDRFKHGTTQAELTFYLIMRIQDETHPA